MLFVAVEEATYKGDESIDANLVETKKKSVKHLISQFLDTNLLRKVFHRNFEEQRVSKPKSMGQALSEPQTNKTTNQLQNGMVFCGASSMQGWRCTMEDDHLMELSMQSDPSSLMFGVFDGHGGVVSARFAKEHLISTLVSQQKYAKNVREALVQTYLDLDDKMRSDESVKRDMSGTTAITVLLKNNIIYCANVGDSRAIASYNGEVHSLSMDHKPTIPNEAKRINTAGGFVEFGRVNGNLALSRALGDFSFKTNSMLNPEEQMVTAYPDINTRHLTEDYEFIVIACDGIWDVMTNEEVLNFVRLRIAQGHEPGTICEQLMNKCLAPRFHVDAVGCDNMTVVIVCLLFNKTYEELRRKCNSGKTHISETDFINGSKPKVENKGDFRESQDDEIINTNFQINNRSERVRRDVSSPYRLTPSLPDYRSRYRNPNSHSMKNNNNTATLTPVHLKSSSQTNTKGTVVSTGTSPNTNDSTDGEATRNRLNENNNNSPISLSTNINSSATYRSSGVTAALNHQRSPIHSTYPSTKPYSQISFKDQNSSLTRQSSTTYPPTNIYSKRLGNNSNYYSSSHTRSNTLSTTSMQTRRGKNPLTSSSSSISAFARDSNPIKSGSNRKRMKNVSRTLSSMESLSLGKDPPVGLHTPKI
ncbi:hypothetical protein SNEBB_009386 [Seison nebaliae]|nr:hypothetical protein SNEBB_009386 [Seison nebaliae]